MRLHLLLPLLGLLMPLAWGENAPPDVLTPPVIVSRQSPETSKTADPDKPAPKTADPDKPSPKVPAPKPPDSNTIPGGTKLNPPAMGPNVSSAPPLTRVAPPVISTPASKPLATPPAGTPPSATGTAGTSKLNTPATGDPTKSDPKANDTTIVNNVAANFQVIDLARGASQEVEISTSLTQPVNYQFTSDNGIITLSLSKDGVLTLTGQKGASELQLQATPVPLSGIMKEFQSLEIKGVTKFLAKKVENKIFVSLRLDPDQVIITYRDKTPDTQTKSKDNYSFRFIVVGYPPVIIPDGKTLYLRQANTTLKAKMSDTYLSLGTYYYQRRDDLVIQTGGSLLPSPISP